MSERENKSLNVRPGTVLKWTNKTTNAESLTFDCGAFGKVEFKVPIGGTVRFTVGTEPFRVFFNEVECDILDAGNVVQLKTSI